MKDARLYQLVHRLDNEDRRAEFAHVHNAINERAKYEEYREDCTVWFQSWSRDCDCVEVQSKPFRKDATSLFKLQRQVEQDRYDACEEGPGAVWPIYARDVPNARSYESDRILAAFEDGHDHYITSLR
jgi:hypothetical protein